MIADVPNTFDVLNIEDRIGVSWTEPHCVITLVVHLHVSRSAGGTHQEPSSP